VSKDTPYPLSFLSRGPAPRATAAPGPRRNPASGFLFSPI